MMRFIICMALMILELNGNDIDRNEKANNVVDFDLGRQSEAANRGKEKLKDYQSKDSPCWVKAVSELKAKCSEMTDMEQSILAMKFANCHFERSGSQTYPCINEKVFKTCTNSMKKEDPTSFIVYTEFFTHVTDICFHLQSEIWRKRTSNTISQLSLTTEETVFKLDQSLRNQDMVLESQSKSLSNQQKILENEDNLKQTLENSTASAKAAFQEMKQKADEQQAIFSHTFDGIFHGVDKLMELQTMLLGEFIGLQSVAFYLASLISCYLFTSSPRTIGARLILFASFAFLVAIEKMIVDWGLKHKEHLESPNEWLHKQVWLIRKVFIAFSLFVLGYMATKYKDINQINNKILQEIQERVLELYDMERKRKGYALSIDGSHKDGNKDLGSITDGQIPKAGKLECQTDVVSCSTPQKHWMSSSDTSLGESPIESNKPQDEINVTNLMFGSTGRVLFSDDGYDLEDEIVQKKKIKKFSKKNFLKRAPKSSKKTDVPVNKNSSNVSESHNTSVTSRYNLRSRSTTPSNSLNNGSLLHPVTSSRKRGKKNEVASPLNAVGLFSSDED